jgi:hypothetical protein
MATLRILNLKKENGDWSFTLRYRSVVLPCKIYQGKFMVYDYNRCTYEYAELVKGSQHIICVPDNWGQLSRRSKLKYIRLALKI